MFGDFKRFKFFLDDGLKSEPQEIDAPGEGNSPDGWTNMQVVYQRSSTYGGVNRLLTLPLKFVGKGAFMIRNQIYKYLIGAQLLFFLYMQNDDGFNYDQIYSGRLQVSKWENTIGGIQVPVVNNDFTAAINAYDTTKFSISMEQPSAINVELTPIALNEIANLLPSGPPDGVIHSDYFPPIQVVNNQQNSINPSVQNVFYGQLRDPDFSISANWFFNCQLTGKLLMTVNISITIHAGVGANHLILGIFNQAGVMVQRLYEVIGLAPGSTNALVNFSSVLSVTKGDKLFLYMQEVEAETAGTGIDITGGEIDLSYQTSTPASMCKALRGIDLFALILQAMNMSPSGPSLPVPVRSVLLTTALKNVVFTSSDSIRQAVGSIYHADDVIYPGVYKVLFGTVEYNGGEFTVGQSFTYINGIETFTSPDNAVAQKTQSISVGNVYNIGDSLQAGGTYLVGGADGQFATYNSVNYNVGQFFKYVLGQESFTGSDDTVFVKQTAEDPQIIISLEDFFQDIRGIQGGDAAFGFDTTMPAPYGYIETLDYVYRKTVTAYSMGVIDETAKDEPATDLQGNKIKVGYKDQQYSSVNGRTETNSEQRYGTGLLDPDNEIDLTCSDRADCLGIEEIRITQADTAASRSDNDTFMIYLKDDPEPSDFFVYYHPLRTEGLMINPSSGLPMISGVTTEFYNWMLSPKRNLLRGSRYLASIFYGLKGYKIRLVGFEKNTAMVTTDINGVRVSEASTLNVADLLDPYFIPIYWTVTGGNTKQVLKMLDTNPFGKIAYEFNGLDMRAFIVNFALRIGDDKPQSLKLLLSPDNNLLDLIH